MPYNTTTTVATGDIITASWGNSYGRDNPDYLKGRSGAVVIEDVITGASGTALAPGFAFSGDPNTGIYNSNADQVDIATGGTRRFSVTTTLVESTLKIAPNANGTLDLGGNGATWKDVYAARLLTGDGSASAPGLAFSGDTNTGLFRNGADDIQFSIGGTGRLRMTTSTINMNNHTDPGTDATYNLGTSSVKWLNAYSGTFQGNAGSASAPTFSFASDANTGIYSSTADQVDVTTGGTLRWSASSAGITSTVKVLPSADNSLDIGASGTRWANVYGTAVVTSRTSGPSVGSIYFRTVQLANDATAVIGTTNKPAAWIFIHQDSGTWPAAFVLYGATNATAQVVAPDAGHYSQTAGTGSRTNIYYSAGNSRYEIENKTGSTVNYYIAILSGLDT